MTRAHIAMIGIPAVSHVRPGLDVIRELVARGHRVTYANDPAVADLIKPTGAELVPCTSVLPVADNDWPDDPVAAMSLFLDDAVHALPQLRAFYDDDPAVRSWVADQEVARRSAQLRAEARAEGGTPRAVQLVENVLV